MGSRRKRLAGIAALAAVVVAVPAVVLAVASGRGDGARDARQAPQPLLDHPVVAAFEPDDVELSGCEQPACFEQAFGNVAYRDGPKESIRLLEAAMASTPAVSSGCHRITHFIGAAALARYEGNVAKALAEGSATCWSGYYHGILERAFWSVSSRDELAAKARDVCSDAGIRRVPFQLYQCVHGLGHGLMLRTGYDLPFSLAICDELELEWDRTSCHGGVFMENISSSYGVRSRWLKDDDLIYPCKTVAEKHKLYCYLMVTSRVLQHNGYSWEGTVRVCAGVERDWRSTCFQSLGRDASGITHQDPSGILEICGLAGAFLAECVYGAARDITANDAGGRRAAAFCTEAPAATRTGCFHGVGTVLGGMAVSAERRRALCAAVTTTFTDACEAGATGRPRPGS